MSGIRGMENGNDTGKVPCPPCLVYRTTSVNPSSISRKYARSNVLNETELDDISESASGAELRCRGYAHAVPLSGIETFDLNFSLDGGAFLFSSEVSCLEVDRIGRRRKQDYLGFCVRIVFLSMSDHRVLLGVAWRWEMVCHGGEQKQLSGVIGSARAIVLFQSNSLRPSSIIHGRHVRRR